MMYKPFKPLTIRKPSVTNEITENHASEQPAKRRKVSPPEEKPIRKPIESQARTIAVPVINNERRPLIEVANPPSPTESVKPFIDNGLVNYYSVLW